MRIHVLSDLHREFGHATLPTVAADVVVLAGDIDRGAKGVTWAREAFPDTPVLYVAGNHEHYGERLGRLHEKLREAAVGSNVRILENEIFELGGFRFFGSTLWTDFNLFKNRPSAMLAASSKATGMNDYRKIRREDIGKLHPKHTALVHADSLLALMNFLSPEDRLKSVVVTHHAPSPQSLKPHKQTEEMSAAYASNLDELITERGPALWIHGHIHFARDYHIGATRILSNPLGYQTQINSEAGVSRRLGCHAVILGIGGDRCRCRQESTHPVGEWNDEREFVFHGVDHENVVVLNQPDRAAFCGIERGESGDEASATAELQKRARRTDRHPYVLTMGTTSTYLVEEALALPLPQRAELTRLLISSLDGDNRSDIEIRALLEARLNALTSGKDRGMSLAEVFGEKR